MGRRDPAVSDPSAFRHLVAEAIDAVPAEFQPYLRNVAIVVAEEPSADDLLDAGLDPRSDTLYGLYQGVPLPERPHDFAGAPPDRITIFRRPLVRDFRTSAALRREITRTVVHELAHFFGFDDAQIEKLGF